LAGRLYYTAQAEAIVRQKGLELGAIRDLKTAQVVLWRKTLVADGQAMSNDRTSADEIEAWLSSPAGPRAIELRALLDGVVGARGYSAGYILAPGSGEWVGSTGAAPPSAQVRTEAENALRSRSATLTDLFIDPASNAPRLHVTAPLFGTGAAPIASVVLVRDPSTDLYPLIQTWPTPSPSGETLLVRREGDSVVYLNKLRFHGGTALKTKLPVSDTTLLAVQALTGAPRAVTGTDYRDIPVLGAVGPIPGSAWYIVAKLDQSEAYATILDSQRLTLLTGALVLLVVGFGLAFAWRQRTVSFYQQAAQGERALLRLSEQYDYLAQFANDAIILADADGDIVQVNDRAMTLYGYTRAELLGMSITKLQSGSQPVWIDAVESGPQISNLVESEQLRRDGSVFDAEISARAIQADDGLHHLAIVRDITERKLAEEQLRQTSAYLERLINYANAPIIVWDPELRITRFNRAFERLTGESAGSMVGRPLGVLFPPETLDLALAQVSRAAAGETWEDLELPVVRSDGSVRVALWNSAPVYEADGVTLQAVIAQGQDITARKAAEEGLAKSEARFRSIIDASPTAMYLYELRPDDRLVLTAANPATDTMAGIKHAELIGKTIEEAFPGLVGTDVAQTYRAVARGELETQAFELPYADERFSGYYAVTVFRTGPDTVAVDYFDITARRRAEEELRERTEDLVRSNAELEKFAYVASHDLQEPLRMVASYTQLLKKRYQGQLDSDADDFIAYAVDGATRMQTLINELLAYSRVGTQGTAFSSADLEVVLAQVLRALRPAMEENAATVEHDPMPTIVCDATQIGQVFQNLISNAIKFHGETPPSIHVGATRVEGAWEFTVRDNGIGVEPQYFERIFVIFQRLQSRAEYPGTGMGLAICKRIVERHGGEIWVESKPGEGSAFHFTIRDLLEG
jgi:PAS domain S-box-containing protein